MNRANLGLSTGPTLYPWSLRSPEMVSIPVDVVPIRSRGSSGSTRDDGALPAAVRGEVRHPQRAPRRPATARAGLFTWPG